MIPSTPRRAILRCLLFMILAIALLAGARAHAAPGAPDPNAQFQLANKNFEDGQYAEALAGYDALIDAGQATSTVYANAGTAAWRDGQVGRAVALYERALRLDPTDERAAHNLARITPETNRLADDASAFAIARDVVARIPSAVFIAGIEVFFLLLLVALWVWSRTASTSPTRGGWGLRAGMAAGALAVMIAAAFLHEAARHRWGDAVLLEKGVSRLGPGERFFEQMELPAGTTVELPEPPANGWVRVRLRDGRTGFVESRLLERLSA